MVEELLAEAQRLHDSSLQSASGSDMAGVLALQSISASLLCLIHAAKEAAERDA